MNSITDTTFLLEYSYREENGSYVVDNIVGSIDVGFFVYGIGIVIFLMVIKLWKN